MTILDSGYQLTGRAISTDAYPHGSTLLGASEGLASRISLAASLLSEAAVSPNLISILLNDGSFLYLSGSFGQSFTTESAFEFINRVSGHINQIVEIEAVSPNAPRYTLSNLNIAVQDYFSTASWDDVLTGYDTLIGGPGRDDLIDYGNHNTFSGMGGNDFLVARSRGLNKAIYRGDIRDYRMEEVESISFTNHTNLNGWKVTDSIDGRDGVDSLVNIDRIEFADTNVALDVGHGENAGMAYRMYKAAFDRVPDAEGLGFWIDALDRGYTLEEISNVVTTTPEFQRVYGENSSNHTFVNLLYQHVLHREADTEGFNFWNDALNAGYSRGAVLAVYTETPENLSQTAPLVATGVQYQVWLGQ